MVVSALTMCYFSFRSSSMLQATVCEELARQPELMRDMAESGLNLENCEYWFERAVVAVLGALLVFAVARVSLLSYFAPRSPLFPCATPPFRSFLALVSAVYAFWHAILCLPGAPY